MKFHLFIALFGFLILQIGSVSAQNRIAKDVNAKEFSKLIESKKGVILDVRTPGEVSRGSIKGHSNLDIFDDHFESKIDALDKSVPVYIYCASGGRSAEAMGIMKKKGFSELYNLSGGYSAWSREFKK